MMLITGIINVAKLQTLDNQNFVSLFLGNTGFQGCCPSHVFETPSPRKEDGLPTVLRDKG